MKTLLSCLFFLFFMLASSGFLVAQKPDSVFFKLEFERLDYDKTVKKIALKRLPVSDIPNVRFPFLSKNIMFVLFCILLVIILGTMVSGLRKEVKLTPGNAVINQAIDDIGKVDLQALLDRALLEENYRLAFRYRFLLILQSLQHREYIRWNKHKTNRHYITEMPAEYRNAFRKVALIFDKTWYGQIELTREDFDNLSQNFRDFEIKSQTP